RAVVRHVEIARRIEGQAFRVVQEEAGEGNERRPDRRKALDRVADIRHVKVARGIEGQAGRAKDDEGKNSEVGPVWGELLDRFAAAVGGVKFALGTKGRSKRE